MPILIKPEDLNSNYLIDERFNNYIFEVIADVENKPDNIDLLRYQVDNFIIIKLQNNQNNSLLSTIRLKIENINGQNYYVVNKVNSIIKKMGYAKFLYEYCFTNLNLPVISDNIQTRPGSYNLWKSFLINPNEKYEILIFNTETNNKMKYSTRNFNDYKIWGWDGDFINLAQEDPKFLYDALKYGDLNSELYAFLNSNIDKVKDRKNIRLLSKKK